MTEIETKNKEEYNRRGQRKFYEKNPESVKKNVLLTALRKGRKSSPQTLDKHNVRLYDFTQAELSHLNEKVLSYLQFKEKQSINQNNHKGEAHPSFDYGLAPL